MSTGIPKQEPEAVARTTRGHAEPLDLWERILGLIELGRLLALDVVETVSQTRKEMRTWVDTSK